MKKNFLLCLLSSGLILIGTSCGTDKKETVQEGQSGVSDKSEERPSPFVFEKHEVKAYPDAIIEMYSPYGNDNFEVGKVPFEFNIKNYPFNEGLKGFQYRLSINGNNPISYHLPIFHREFNQGTYRVVAYLIDKEGFALKEFGNYVDRDFTVGESQPFPNSDEPYMVLNLPQEDQIYSAEEEVFIDYLLIGGGLKEEGLKFAIEVDGQQHNTSELFPVGLKNLPVGKHTVTVKLVKENGQELDGIFTSAKRSITIK